MATKLPISASAVVAELPAPTCAAPANRSAFIVLLSLMALLLVLLLLPRMFPTNAFANPILQQGQDPSIAYWHGSYYLVQSEDDQIVMYKAPTLTGIASGAKATLLSSACCQLWAPELIPLDGKWYIYYALAPTGENASHRMYVLESDGDDPFGPYHQKGKIAAATDNWAIDGTVLRMGHAIYFIWSGWPGASDGQQNLYIAPMSNPWTISGDRFLLSAPTAPWERTPGSLHVNLEEGPEVLQHNGRTFLVYSTRGSWTDGYCLGMLTYTGGDVTNSASWTKSNGCVFAPNPAAGVYGPGHNTFTQSPDGSQNWIVYHADSQSGTGWAGRSIRAQQFTWNPDGSPNFGVPVSTSAALTIPSGQPKTAASLPICFC